MLCGEAVPPGPLPSNSQKQRGVLNLFALFRPSFLRVSAIRIEQQRHQELVLIAAVLEDRAALAALDLEAQLLVDVDRAGVLGASNPVVRTP